MTTTLAGFARTVNPATDIITAYAAAPYMPTPTPDPSPWVVIGSFTVPQQVQGHLAVTGFVVGDAICSVGLYDPNLVTPGFPIRTSVEQTTLSPHLVQLFPDKVYQIAVRFIGSADPGNIAVIRTVSLVP